MYLCDTPRSYLGWGKSHQLGTGLGLALGAKLAAPDKFCVNFMGDAAFGMTGLDFETAVRENLPICTVVLKNSTMAVETTHMAISHEKYGTRDVGGEYADIARALGGWAKRVEDPAEVGAAFVEARRKTEEGVPALLEFITSEELAYSHAHPFVDSGAARVTPRRRFCPSARSIPCTCTRLRCHRAGTSWR